MNAKERKQILKNKKLILSGFRKFTHFELSFYLILISIFFVVFYFLGDAGITSIGRMKPLITYLITGIPFTIAVLFYVWRYNQLDFHVIKLECSEEDVIKAIEQTSHKLNWTKRKQGKNNYVATTSPESMMSFNWGEEITIVWNEEVVLINSICNPNSSSALFSMGRNAKNIEFFESKLLEYNGSNA